MTRLGVVGALAAVALGCWHEPQAATEESRIIRVGPNRELTMPSQAAKIAVDGSIVEIDAGVYPEDSAVWRRNNLTLRAVGGRAHLRSNGRTSQGKGIWVIKGDNTYVENIEFSGARVEAKNGAGIRQEGSGLTVVGCRFHDNENGILSSRQPESEIVIEHSEFSNNGSGNGKTHNIYIGHVKRFTLRHSYIHHAKVGHQVKTRAAENHILYNRIMDEESGTSSYAIDLPEGGEALVLGNVIQQGENATNSGIVNYASKLDPEAGRLYFVHNTVVNDRGSGIFIRNYSVRAAHVVNNIFAGRGETLNGLGDLSGNLVTSAAGFVDRSAYDYHLTSDSPAIDAGVDVGPAPFSLTPDSEYAHPAKKRPRRRLAALDVGAFEYSGR